MGGAPVNTSSMMAEFASLQKQRASLELDETRRQRFEDLRQALFLASRWLPVSIRPVDATGPRLRIKDGRAVREIAFERLSQDEIEAELEAPAPVGELTVVAVAPGPGIPASVAYARNLGPSPRGSGWYRLSLE